MDSAHHSTVRGDTERLCGCFPTGRHYPGIADRLAALQTVVIGLCRDYEPAVIWAQAPLAVIDFETTGLNVEIDRVIEVGLICFDEGKLTARHNWLVNPGMAVPAEALAVHQISDDDLKLAPSFSEVIESIAEILKGRIPVAYNADFDRAFFLRELSRCNAELAAFAPACDPEVAWIDPLVWARELFKDQKSRKLVDIAQELGVQLESAHRATDDAEATGHVLLAMSDRLPHTYGELIRLQGNYKSRQHADTLIWRNRSISTTN